MAWINANAKYEIELLSKGSIEIEFSKYNEVIRFVLSNCVGTIFEDEK